MVEPFSAAAGFLIGSSKKEPGPLRKAVFEDLEALYKAWSGPRRKNLEEILSRGAKRAGRVEDPVHPRVVHTVMEHGSWVTDSVEQEYFAGLLLSSSSEDGNSDDGVHYANTVAAMTSNQVRLHHVIYLHFAQHLPANYASTEVRLENAVWIPVTDAASLVNIIDGDDPIHALAEALDALHQLGLVSSVGACSPAEWAEHGVTTAIDSMMAVVTDAGMRLFLRAYGIRTSDSNRVTEYDWSTVDSIGGSSPYAMLSSWQHGFSADPARTDEFRS